MIDINDKCLSGYAFIDLFAGIGGFHLAMESLGATCVYANEWNRQAQEVYADNFGIIPGDDITKVDERTVPDHDILCAGFPCQAFSISGKQLGFADTRGTLFFDVARIVREKRPRVVFMENVKNFARHDHGKTISVVERTMNELGYSFDYAILKANDYGVPQQRERTYMVCLRRDVFGDDCRFDFPKPIRLERHVRDILLPDDMTSYLNVSRDDMRLIPDADNQPDSDKPIRIGTVGHGGQGERIYSVNGSAITLSAYGGGVFAKTGGYLVHGNVRRLHPRECARLMGFPEDYRIAKRTTQAYQQFGNSVVVDVLQYIGIGIGTRLRDLC